MLVSVSDMNGSSLSRKGGWPERPGAAAQSCFSPCVFVLVDGVGTGEKCGFVRKRIGFAGFGLLFVCLLNVGFKRLYFRKIFE